ncbi:hypothetical protein IW262DRAFT_892358 [Armillaria fumosa]|nr:hypothetical protein IW262DRAFT_892358 [Armillaria fumosa]
MNLQVLIYYKRYPNDWSLYLYSVALFWVLDSIHFALGTHALYHYLIDMYGNFLGALLENAIWSMRLQLLLKVWIIVFVQGIYAIRLWKLGRHFHKILPWFVFIAMAVSFGAGILMSYETYIPPNLLTVSTVRISIYIFYSVAITTDFIIALMMCYYLHESRVIIHLPLSQTSWSNATCSRIGLSYKCMFVVRSVHVFGVVRHFDLHRNRFHTAQTIY